MVVSHSVAFFSCWNLYLICMNSERISNDSKWKKNWNKIQSFTFGVTSGFWKGWFEWFSRSICDEFSKSLTLSSSPSLSHCKEKRKKYRLVRVCVTWKNEGYAFHIHTHSISLCSIQSLLMLLSLISNVESKFWLLQRMKNLLLNSLHKW